MASLTIAYMTARREPQFQWFFDSLRQQITVEDSIKIILVDILANVRDMSTVDTLGFDVRHVLCRPNVWQGAHRLTSADYWAVSTYRNTAVCLCETEWFAVIDDRSVVVPTYLSAIRRAMAGHYAVAGRYQKRMNMEVDSGVITGAGVITGEDPRWKEQRSPVQAPGGWFYGANSAQPLEFLLKVNGWDESCDSLGLEDGVYGHMLERNGLPIRYDPEMMIIEDRSVCAVEPPLAKRTDKGVSPNDKSHGILERTAGKKRATHDVDLRAVREALRRGESFPIPTGPTHDWWDNQPLSEFV